MTAANLSLTLVYRGEMALFMAANVAVPIVSLLIWRAALAGGASLPVGKRYLTTYFVVLSFVTMATGSWLSWFLSEDIRLGRLSSWLIRPASLLHGFVANNISEKILKAVILLPMVGILAAIFSASIHIPADPTRWLLFAVSTFLGAVLVFVFDILVGALAFWFDDTDGIDRARVLVMNLLSGAVVPLALMPGWLHGFVSAQPFRFTVSFPVEIVIGGLSSGQIATGFVLQFGYVAGLCLVARLVWLAGLRAYSAVGA